MSAEMKLTGFETNPEGEWVWLGFLDEVQTSEGVSQLLDSAKKKAEERDNYRVWYIDLNNMEGS